MNHQEWLKESIHHHILNRIKSYHHIRNNLPKCMVNQSRKYCKIQSLGQTHSDLDRNHTHNQGIITSHILLDKHRRTIHPIHKINSYLKHKSPYINLQYKYHNLFLEFKEDKSHQYTHHRRRN